MLAGQGDQRLDVVARHDVRLLAGQPQPGQEGVAGDQAGA
jgi:hypothetical protein